MIRLSQKKFVKNVCSFIKVFFFLFFRASLQIKTTQDFKKNQVEVKDVLQEFLGYLVHSFLKVFHLEPSLIGKRFI